MEINKKAPLAASQTCDIKASVERVWSLMTDIENWPNWQPDITSAKPDSYLKPGTKFRWIAKGLKIDSTIQVYKPQEVIGWTGSSFGMKAIHLWKFEPLGDNRTCVKTEESLSGWFPRVIKIIDPLFLERSLMNSLGVLKTTMEKGDQS